jgi:hypothetical protein
MQMSELTSIQPFSTQAPPILSCPQKLQRPVLDTLMDAPTL